MTLDKFLDKFKRSTSNKSYIKEIEGLRFVAIFFVVLSHIIIHMIRVMNIHEDEIPANLLSFIYLKGGFGVHLFFTLSGFILSIPYIKSYTLNEGSVSIKNYFLRRVTRLEPPFIISTLIFFVLYVFFMNGVDSLKHLFYTLTYSHYFVFKHWSPINPVTWSLETEIQFYIIAPIIFYTIFKPRKTYVKLFVFFTLLVMGFWGYFQFHETLDNIHLGKSLLKYINFFLVGMMAGYYYILYLQKNNTKNILYDIIGIISLTAIIYTHEMSLYLYYPVQVTACFLLIISSFKGLILNKVFSNRIICIIGGMCYSIYLLHYAFIYMLLLVLKKYFIEIDSFNTLLITNTVIILPLLLITCAVFFLLFEKPFMGKNWFKLKNKIKLT